MKKRKTPIRLLIDDLKLLKQDYEDNQNPNVKIIDDVIQLANTFISIEKDEIIRIVVDGYEIGIEIKTGFNNAEEYYHYNFTG